MAQIHECDNGCGKQSRAQVPTTWFQIKVTRLDGYPVNGYGSREFLCCDECIANPIHPDILSQLRPNEELPRDTTDG